MICVAVSLFSSRQLNLFCPKCGAPGHHADYVLDEYNEPSCRLPNFIGTFIACLLFDNENKILIINHHRQSRTRHRTRKRLEHHIGRAAEVLEVLQIELIRISLIKKEEQKTGGLIRIMARGRTTATHVLISDIINYLLQLCSKKESL